MVGEFSRWKKEGEKGGWVIGFWGCRSIGRAGVKAGGWRNMDGVCWLRAIEGDGGSAGKYPVASGQGRVSGTQYLTTRGRLYFTMYLPR